MTLLVLKYSSILISLHYGCLLVQFDSTLANNVPVNNEGHFEGIQSDIDLDKIVGGVQAAQHEFPAIATLTDLHTFCACSIIDKEWVLTAAHCAGSPASQYKVTANAYNIRRPSGAEVTTRVSRVIRHPNYDASTGANDIALMKLSTPLTLNDVIQRISLAPQNFVPGDHGTVAGWGLEGEDLPSQPSTIRKVTIPIFSEQKCKEFYNDTDTTRFTVEILPGVLCAGKVGSSACYGDSGGHFLCPKGTVEYGWLCGIVSSGAKCGDVGIYTRVSYYHQWIAKETGISFDTL